MRRLAFTLLILVTTQLHAASRYPPGYSWKTLTTDHFYIHFHQGEESLASRAAGHAENAHRELVPLLGWSPRERTHLVLTDHVGLSNGSANPFPNNTIEIYVSAPGADPTSSIGFYDDWLGLVIHHEYAHILHLDQSRGFSKATRKVFGRMPLLSFPNALSPLWMLEGIATLAESETTRAGRLKGTFLDMVLRTAAIENRFASESEASGLGPVWPAGSSRYFYGAKFLSWLATKRGGHKLTEFVNDYSTNVVPFRINATSKEVYGQSMKSLWREWSTEQKQIYQTERDRLALEGLTERHPLTSLGYETTHPLLSPDGTRIAYAHHGPYERPTLRVRDLASGRDVKVHAVNATSTVSWSRDGKFIAYSDLELVNTFSLLSDVYVWDLERNTSRRVTYGARIKDPAFTPEEKSLIAVWNGLGKNRLVEVDVATGSIRTVVDPPDERQFGEPEVSHDGSRIAVAEWIHGTIDVVIYDRSGKRVATLTEAFRDAINASPRFSPDDQEVWFSSDVTGVPNIYAVPSSGGRARRLTNVYGGAFYPTSMDGRRFYFSDYSSKGFDLASFDAQRDFAIVPRTIPGTVMDRPVSTTNTPVALGEGVPATDYSPWRSLRPRWWFPILSSTSVDGTDRSEIGFITGGADALGRHSYDATITNRSYGVFYSYDRFYPTLSLGASRYGGDVMRFVSPGLERTYTQTTNRFLAEVSVPWRKVGRQFTTTAGIIRDSVDGDSAARISQEDLDRVGVFQGTLQGIRLGMAFNSAREFAFSISPEGGLTASAGYENLSRKLGSDRAFQQLRAGVRGYLTIPYDRSPLGRHVVALRAAGGSNSGDFILQRELKVGGLGGGEPAALDDRDFPVRGYDSGTLRGARAAIASLEYRFPLYEIERGPITTPLFFNRLHGDVFVDAGRAWRQRVEGRTYDTIASTGAEVSADFVIGNLIPIRFRTGVAFLLRDPGKGDVQPFVLLGSSF